MTADLGTGLYVGPVLAIDAGVHSGRILGVSIDRVGRRAVTGSEDKTVRVWRLEDGALERTIRLPSGPGNVGKVYTVAISGDGATIAVGGWIASGQLPGKALLLFDTATGELESAIGDLPGEVTCVAFSPDGNTLAALVTRRGLMLFHRRDEWAAVTTGISPASGHGLVYSDDGASILSAQSDGLVRLHDAAGRLQRVTDSQGEPYGISINPRDGTVAVGLSSGPQVRVLGRTTLHAHAFPDVAGLDWGNLGRVAWSADGETLYAGGRYMADGRGILFSWDRRGAGERKAYPVGRGAIMSLHRLPLGGLFVATGDPIVARLDPDGRALWEVGPQKIDPRGALDGLRVSAAGTVVEIGRTYRGENRFRFDVRDLVVRPAINDDQVAPPIQAPSSIDNWRGYEPTFNGWPILLEAGEQAHALAIHPLNGGIFLARGSGCGSSIAPARRCGSGRCQEQRGW